MTLSELKSKYMQALSTPPSSEDEESVCVLWQNDWVRILAVHNIDAPKKWRIEVEVSLPSKLMSTVSHQSLSNNQAGDEVKRFVQELIKHLEYLLSLGNEGLILGVMSRDGLWTAYIEMDESPPDSLFKALIPPSM